MRGLVETEIYLRKNENELYKTLLEKQSLIKENEYLKIENDDLKQRNYNLKQRNDALSSENNELKNENDDLSKKHNNQSVSRKIQTKPIFTIKETNEYSKENKTHNIKNNDIKIFLNECKKSIKEIQSSLFGLRNVDNSKKEIYLRNTRRKSYCANVNYESTKLHYKLINKLKKIPEDSSTLQIRRTISAIDQHLNIIIECSNSHNQLTTKAEMDTCTTSALQAVDIINSIINNFQ